MKLHNRSEFNDLILTTSLYFKLRPVYVEKDYWLTYALKNLSRSEYNQIVVFKGGTCLSKAYKLIKRFSEDIDLALIKNESLSSNQCKSLIKKIEHSIIDNNFKSEEDHALVSKGSKFRKAIYSYPQIINGNFDQVYNKLILEINAFANPYPFQKIPITSYIGEYLSDIKSDIIEKFDLGSFELNVLSLERTFVEKIMALVRASYESDTNLDKLKEKIRHIYDIIKLMETTEIKNLLLNKAVFFKLIQEIQNDSKNNQDFHQDWLIKELSQAVLFNETARVIKELESVFTEEFVILMFDGEKIPSYAQMDAELQKISDLLKEYDKL